MEHPEDDRPESDRQRPSVPRYLALALLGLALATSGFAIYFATEAADASADAEILMDGVDRSGLPREQAVALAELARSQSSPVIDDGGHHHGESDAHASEMTSSDQDTFDRQWAAAAAEVDGIDTIEEAEAAGYRQGSGWSDGAGFHWIKWSLVDEPFDPARPSMLLFEELVRGEELALIAYSYWVTSEDTPEGFAGELDEWHRHLGVCFKNGWIKDENLLRSECPGDWVNGNDLWMLHAWVVPGLENEYGQFHNVNPFLCERTCGLEN